MKLHKRNEKCTKKLLSMQSKEKIVWLTTFGKGVTTPPVTSILLLYKSNLHLATWSLQYWWIGVGSMILCYKSSIKSCLYWNWNRSVLQFYIYIYFLPFAFNNSRRILWLIHFFLPHVSISMRLLSFGFLWLSLVNCTFCLLKFIWSVEKFLGGHFGFIF